MLTRLLFVCGALLCAALSSGLSAQAVEEFCVDGNSGTIEVDPVMPNGGYSPGTVVTMTLTLNEFNAVDGEWVHAVIPSLGVGFDDATLMPFNTPVYQTTGSGEWIWVESWSTCLGCTGAGGTSDFGPGFAVDNNRGMDCGATGLDGDPGNNYGDQTMTSAGGGVFQWSVTTITPPFGVCPGEAFRVDAYVTADGVTGSFTGSHDNGPCTSPCADDVALCWPRVTNVQVTLEDEACGEVTLNGTYTQGQVCDPQSEWQFAGQVYASNQDLITVDQAGEYTYVVFVDGCMRQAATYTIEEVQVAPMEIELTASDNPLCEGQETTISVDFINPGKAPFEYDWSPARSGDPSSITVSPYVNNPTTYSVTVTDADGCEAETTIDINLIQGTELTDFEPFVGVCYGSPAYFFVPEEPGVNYTWSFGPDATPSVATGADPGPVSFNPTSILNGGWNASLNVSVTATRGNNGCTDIYEYEGGIFVVPDATATIETPASCDGTGASVRLDWWTPGIQNYAQRMEVSVNSFQDFTVHGLWTSSPNNASRLFSNLSPGEHLLEWRIQTAPECVGSVLVVIPEPTPPVVTVDNDTTSCTGFSNGSLTAMVEGDPADFTYSWNTAGSPATQTISGLSPGTYEVTITTLDGSCSSTATGSITEPDPVSASVENDLVVCYGESNGQLTVMPSGGTPPYTYNWESDSGASFGSTQTISNLPADVYHVTVTDANSCTAVATGEITEPGTDFTVGITETNVSCWEGDDGRLFADPDGGPGPFEYEWADDSGGTYPDQPLITDLGAGNYFLTVTDFNGCVATATAIVSFPAFPFTVSVANIVLDCAGDSDGQLSIRITPTQTSLPSLTSPLELIASS